MRRTPSKVSRRPITQHNVHNSPPQKAKTPGVVRARPVTVVDQVQSRMPHFQIYNSPLSPKVAHKYVGDALGSPERGEKEEQERGRQGVLEGENVPGDGSQRVPASPARVSLSASPLLSKYRKKYDIENHSYLNIPGASLFCGVLQRDEASILKEKKVLQQQEVKAALQIQIKEKQKRLEAERRRQEKGTPEESKLTEIAPKPENQEANPQSDTPGNEVEPGEPKIEELYQEIVKEHENLKAKVESQEIWIQQLVWKSVNQLHEESPLLGKQAERARYSIRNRGKKAQITSVSQRRAHSSASGLPIDPFKPASKMSDFSLFLDESIAQKGDLPATSTPTPVHSKAAEKNLDAGGTSMFIYPSSGGGFEQNQLEIKSFLVPEIKNRRETSVPRQRREVRERTPNLRFPKDVFPMNLKRRPTLV